MAALNAVFQRLLSFFSFPWLRQQNVNYGGDQYVINQPGAVTLQPPNPSARPRNEQILLEEVRDNVISSRAQSLYRAVLISLGKESQPDKVILPWRRVIHIGPNPATPIPAEKTIAQIFDAAAITGKLLILGQPGAGKTTTLLELAKALVERAQEDINQPIPIILSLSNWKDEKQPIRDWIIAELSKKHESNRVSQWLSERKLLPLLDGLDEVASERQESCINRINEFLNSQSAPRDVVVCSRLEEYEHLANRLQLNGAICLKSLENKQIQDYLAELGQPILWQMLSNTPKLLELVRAPIFLNITLLTYPEDSNDKWQQWQNAEDPLKFLLEAYIERRLSCQLESQAYGKLTLPEPFRVRFWLWVLANQMRLRSQTEFLIEDLQPWMLLTKEKGFYRPLIGVIWGLSLGLMVFLSFWPLLGLNSGLLVGSSIGLFIGLFFGWFSPPDIDPVENLKWSGQTLRQSELSSVLTVLSLVGLFLMVAFEFSYGRNDGLAYVLAYVLAVFFPVTVFLMGTGGLTQEAVERKVTPNQGIKRSAQNSAIVGLIFALIFGLYFGSASNPVAGISTGACFGLLIAGLFGGGDAYIKHFTLRILLYMSKIAPWNYARFLNYCTELLLLQRVGGRYRFIHKYLQDHFADMF